MRRCIPLLLTGLLALPAAGAEAPLVVAVDGSRSLAPGDVAAVAGAVRDLADALEPDAAIGLLRFADDTAWLAPPGSSPAAAAAAAAELAPAGSWTLLNDALVVAVRSLPEGGVVLLLSDGRDENSATTVEDVSRLADAAGVRVLTVAVGERVDERALRRLALVTGGSHLGRLDALPPGELARRTADARRSTEVAAEPADDPTTAPPVATPVPAPAARRELPRWLAVVLGATLVATGALVLVLVRRRRAAAQRRCEDCGVPLEPWETECSRCQVAELESALATVEEDAPAPGYETMVDRGSPMHAALDITVVMDERPVLVVRPPGRPDRTVPLPWDRVVTAGRAPGVNSLVLDDPTVSARHFKIVPKDRQFYVVDLDTTNGTHVNDERVRVRKLRSGDILRAGAVQLDFQIAVRRVG